MFNTEKIEKLEDKIGAVRKEVEKLNELIGKEQVDIDSYFSRIYRSYMFLGEDDYKEKTNEPTIIQRLEAIEKHFNIKWVSEKTEFKGYKPAKKEKASTSKKKAGRPKKK